MRRGRPRKHGIEENFSDKHIIIELRKSIVLTNHLIEFRNGDKQQVTNQAANFILDTYAAISHPKTKQYFQEYVGSSMEVFQDTLNQKITPEFLASLPEKLRGNKVIDSYWAQQEQF